MNLFIYCLRSDAVSICIVSLKYTCGFYFTTVFLNNLWNLIICFRTYSAVIWEFQPLGRLFLITEVFWQSEKFHRWVCVCVVRLYSRQEDFIQHCVHTVYVLYVFIRCEVFYMVEHSPQFITPQVRPLTAKLKDRFRCFITLLKDYLLICPKDTFSENIHKDKSACQCEYSFSLLCENLYYKTHRLHWWCLSLELQSCQHWMISFSSPWWETSKNLNIDASQW